MAKDNGAEVDRLVAEAQRLKEELLRTAAKLEAFSDQLLIEVGQLRDAAKDQHHQISQQIDELGNGGDGKP